jgi:phenylacetic acid degradation operon negative regulatory protein
VGIELTERGRRRLQAINLEQPLSQHQWDGKWRIAIFDIPDSKKLARDTLRRTLRHLGFVQLQESVWVTPYPCEKEIEAAKQLYGIGDDLRLITASHIQGQDSLIQKFDLAPTAR